MRLNLLQEPLAEFFVQYLLFYSVLAWLGLVFFYKSRFSNIRVHIAFFDMVLVAVGSRNSFLP